MVVFFQSLRYRQVHQIHRIVTGQHECARPEIQCIHRLLRVVQRYLHVGQLEYLFREFRDESQGISTVYYGLSQTECQIHYTVLRLFLSDRIEVDRTGHPGKHRVIQFPVFRSADALYDDRHLFLAQEISGGVDICPAAIEKRRCIHALDGFAQQSEHLVLVFGKRNHVGGIYPGERLVVAVLQFRT